MQEQEVARKLELCVGSFKKVLYEPDDIFLKNMEKNNLAGDDISKYQLWEWTQGVGLYGLWKLFERTKDGRYLATLREYYDARIADGLPGKTSTPWRPSWRCPICMNTPATRLTARCAKSGPSGSWTAFPKQRKAAFSTSRPIRSTTASCGTTRCS